MLTTQEVTALGERGLFVRDGFAGREPATARWARLRELPLKPAGVGRDRREGVRGDHIGWIDDEDARFEKLRLALNEGAWLGLARFDLQVARYDAGAAYPRHRDAFAGGPSRRVTAIWYLNPGWRPSDGGLLRLHLDDGPLDVEPLLDRLVVFLSEGLEHEVLPARSERWAVTAWYHGP